MKNNTNLYNNKHLNSHEGKEPDMSIKTKRFLPFNQFAHKHNHRLLDCCSWKGYDRLWSCI